MLGPSHSQLLQNIPHRPPLFRPEVPVLAASTSAMVADSPLVDDASAGAVRPLAITCEQLPDREKQLPASLSMSDQHKLDGVPGSSLSTTTSKTSTALFVYLSSTPTRATESEVPQRNLQPADRLQTGRSFHVPEIGGVKTYKQPC